MHGGKFAFKIDWASLLLGKEICRFLCFTLYLTEISKYKAAWELIFGGAYFRNFTVLLKNVAVAHWKVNLNTVLSIVK